MAAYDVAQCNANVVVPVSCVCHLSLSLVDTFPQLLQDVLCIAPESNVRGKYFSLLEHVASMGFQPAIEGAKAAGKVDRLQIWISP